MGVLSDLVISTKEASEAKPVEAGTFGGAGRALAAGLTTLPSLSAEAEHGTDSIVTAPTPPLSKGK